MSVLFESEIYGWLLDWTDLHYLYLHMIPKPELFELEKPYFELQRIQNNRCEEIYKSYQNILPNDLINALIIPEEPKNYEKMNSKRRKLIQKQKYELKEFQTTLEFIANSLLLFRSKLTARIYKIKAETKSYNDLIKEMKLNLADACTKSISISSFPNSECFKNEQVNTTTCKLSSILGNLVSNCSDFPRFLKLYKDIITEDSYECDTYLVPSHSSFLLSDLCDIERLIVGNLLKVLNFL